VLLVVPGRAGGDSVSAGGPGCADRDL